MIQYIIPLIFQTGPTNTWSENLTNYFKHIKKKETDYSTMVDQLKGEVVGPKDNFKLVYVIFYWLGIGTLLPWNMFITVKII